MKKIYLLLAGLLLFSSTLRAQDTTSYYGKMNYIYAHIDKNQISSGILRDYGIDFLNLDNFAGTTLNDSNYVSLDEWRMLYASLYSAQINTASMLYLDTLNNLLKNNSYSNQPIAFTALYYQYQSLKDNALTANLFTVSNDQLYDVPGRTQSPYQDNDLFAVAPIRQGMLTGNNQLIFKPELIFGNTGKTISAIAVDIDSSGNWQNVTLNSPFNISFSTEGFYPIAIRFTFTDNSIKYAHTKIAVYPNPEALDTLNSGGLQTNSFSPYRTLSNEDITADKSYLGVAGQGDITIQLALNNSTGQIRKPLIVAEGFDPDNGYSFDSYVRSITVNDNTNSQITLNQGLDDINDYDLIFLNYKNGADYIQRNAFLLEKAIAIVNSRKTTYNGVRQSNVVMGLSMGGLVARYALRDMEINNVAHETRLFISHDTPYWGANVPVGAQIAVQHLSPFKIVNTDGNFPYIKWVDLFQGTAESLATFNTPAAKQLLIQRYLLNPANYTLTSDNTVHDAFMNELNTMGWPANCKNITISNGSCDGTPIYPNNSRIFELIGGKSIKYLDNLWLSAAFTIGAPFSPIVIFGGNTNPLAFLVQLPLGLLSTKSSINLDFRINSVPQSGTAELYRGDIYSKRKILGIINVNTYFIKTHINSTSGMLPLDNAPGGVYDINEFGFDANVIQNSLPDFFNGIQATVLQPRFCFVPTVSSLALSNPQQSLFANICNNINCIKPSIISASYVPQQNQLHISYTQESSNFLLEWQNANYNCAQVCSSNLSIQGFPQICNASETYTVPGLPAGVTVNWSISPTSGVASLSTSGNTATLTKTGNGTVSLTANIVTPCATFSKYRIIQSGTSSFDLGFALSGATIINNTDPYFIDLKASGALQMTFNAHNISVQLLAIGSIVPHASGNAFTWLYPNTPSYDGVTVRVQYNSLSCGTPITRYFRFFNSNYVNRFAIYPNPADTQLTIVDGQFDAKALKEEKLSTSSKEIFLYNEKGEVLKSAFIKNNEGEAVLDVKDVPNGTYYLHIKNDKDIIKKQVIIKH
ncbi:T9SS type A sorting domain-containing protein [Pedobacter sp. SD-b]|uniref:T9SS type A sorting domain-containing protein n=1 Tax=Pedobacter segetis TaxID=2793069 RepID=A0ABS1BLE1_9SPHI|nr:T9SS type A sorting domain-containing protein [Pedobacter segetis]MBK0383656.1 T9SS type A sorting domain-containing protein [Pedobacter segetis]